MSGANDRWVAVVGAVGCVLSAMALGGAIGGGCAASTDPGGDGGAGASGATGGNDGQGGVGGAVSLCGQDCSVIQAPDCFVAVCNEGMHPGPIGSCVVVPAENGAACDDQQFCTTADSCQNGVCTGGPQNTCGVDAAPCNTVLCNEASQSCSQTPVPNGEACASGDLCTVGTTCSNGLCIGGTTNDCFFEPVPSECYVSVCDPTTGMCEPQIGNEGGGCVDQNDLCTVNKTCSAGACVGGDPRDCSNLTQGCNIGVCETASGACITQTVMNGQLCDDLNACTTGETCDNSVCSNGTAVTTCELTGDGCCPSNCDATNDLDCQNPCLPYPHVSGFCWVVALNEQETHSAACARISKTPTVTQVTALPWTQQLMNQVTTALGCINLGVTNCCAESLWYYPATNECETHNYGTAYWNYGSWNTGNVGVYTCIP